MCARACACLSVCLSVSSPCPRQAVSEEQPGLKGTRGKEEKSTGKARVREEVGRRRCWSPDLEHSISLALLCQPQSKFSTLDNEGDKDGGETLTKEKEPPKQGKEKAKKAEQVCVPMWRRPGSGCWRYTPRAWADFCKGVGT